MMININVGDLYRFKFSTIFKKDYYKQIWHEDGQIIFELKIDSTNDGLSDIFLVLEVNKMTPQHKHVKIKILYKDKVGYTWLKKEDLYSSIIQEVTIVPAQNNNNNNKKQQ